MHPKSGAHILLKMFKGWKTYKSSHSRSALNVGTQGMNDDNLKLAQLPELKRRREYLNLCYFFKLVHGIFVFPNNPSVLRQINYHTRNSRTDLFV